MPAVYSNILDAVVTGIQGLNLTDIPPAHVVKRKLVSDRKTVLPTLPGIVVASYGNKAPSPTAGTFAKDDIPYQVVVCMFAASDQDLVANQDRQFQWGEAIASKFRSQPLSGVSSVITCNVVSDFSFVPTLFFNGNADVSWIVLKFTSRETRG